MKTQPSIGMKIVTGIICVALAGILLFGLWGIISDTFTKSQSFEQQLFTTSDPLPQSSAETAANELYAASASQPEVLASTLSGFPKALYAAGIEAVDATELDALMDSANGGEIQVQLLDVLFELLSDVDTEYRYTEWTGSVNMLYMAQRDPNAVPSPSNVYLYWEKTALTNTKVLAITVTTDGTTETAYYYLAGGFQRFTPEKGEFTKASSN